MRNYQWRNLNLVEKGTLATVGTVCVMSLMVGLSFNGLRSRSQDNFSGVYLNSPFADGYDVTIESGRNLRIGNLKDDEDSRGGFVYNDVLHVQGNFNSDTIRVDAIYPHFPRGHDLERFVSIEELERVVREVKSAQTP